jgi:thiol:disulfide interchange protein DsbC
MKKITVVISLFATLVFADSQNEVKSIEQKIKAILPNAPISKIEISNIQNIYKAYLPNGQILYIAPHEELIIAGEIFKPNGYSITQQDQKIWQQELEAKQIINLTPLQLTTDSLKVDFGSGSKKYDLVIFTDPECPYCRKVEVALKDKNVTVYYNFMPLSFHKNAFPWSLDILSSKNPKQIIHDILSEKNIKIEHTKEAQMQLDKMIKKAQDLNITGTPKLFVIDKTLNKVVDVINGADIPKIEKYAGKN